VIDDAAKGGTDIFTSALALVEVNKHPDKDAASGADKLRDFFQNDYIIIVAMDRRAGELGRYLMQRHFPSLKPPDASHLASAVIANVDEMHTFDDDLLKLDGRVQKVDGTNLKICKPAMGGPPLPLLESPAEDSAGEEGRRADENSPAVEEDAAAIRTCAKGGANAETSARETAEEELTEDQIEALEDDENTADLNKLEPPGS